MPKLSEVIKQVRLAVPAVSLVLKQDGRERHITLGTGVNVHPYGFVITAKHVVQQHLFDLLGVPIEQLMTTIASGKPLATSTGPVEPALHVVFYAPTPGRMLRLPCPVTEYVLPFQDDDVCALSFPPLEYEGKRVRFHCPQVGGSLELVQGDEVATLGYPYGEELSGGRQSARLSASAGIVSALVPFEGADRRYYNLIQTDMLLNPGNSGGPLFLRESGSVVGIVSSTFVVKGTEAGGSEGDRGGFQIPTGLSFAVPEHRFLDGILQLANEKSGSDGEGVLWLDIALALPEAQPG